MGFSRHIKVMVLTGAVAGVVSIQISGAIWVCKGSNGCFAYLQGALGGYTCLALCL